MGGHNSICLYSLYVPITGELKPKEKTVIQPINKQSLSIRGDPARAGAEAGQLGHPALPSGASGLRKRMLHIKEIQRHLWEEHLDVSFRLYETLSFGHVLFSFSSEATPKKNQDQNLTRTWSSLPLCVWVTSAVVSGWNIQSGRKCTREATNNLIRMDTDSKGLSRCECSPDLGCYGKWFSIKA